MTAGARVKVGRRERAADAGAVSALIEALDHAPGVWLGCDVEAEGLYRRASMGVTDPALAFVLDGAVLQIRALRAVGHCLLPHVARLVASDTDLAQGELRMTVTASAASPRSLFGVLRGFLALFETPYPELGLFGAWSFDYHRLAPGEVPPDDARRRLVLFFSERVLVADAAGPRWVEFDFPGLAPAAPVPAPVPMRAAVPIEPEASAAPGAHAQRVARGVARLRAGDLAALVLSQRFVRDITVAPSAAFALLRTHNPYPAMFTLNLGGGEYLFGASPDLQVRADADWIESAPVCGTLRRGAESVEDAAQAETLLASTKEAAALSACADSDLNDKSLVAVPGTPELLSHRRLHFFNTIIHAIDHTRARRRADADAFEILLAHATPATVTGIPKADALRVIEALEDGWRNWYGGTVARIGSDGSLEAYTVLRAARVIGTVAEVRTGGNLLVDSDPRHEEAETELKAQTLFRVLRGESPGTATMRSANGPRARRRVRVLNLGDPWFARSLDLLARAEIEIDADGEVLVLFGGFRPVDPKEIRALRDGHHPLLAVGGAALGLLQAGGATLARFVAPRFARPADLVPVVPGVLQREQPGQVGLYAAQGVPCGALPPDWQPSAHDGQGWVLAAQCKERAAVALLFRPESALSLPVRTGERAMRAALDALAG